MEADILNTANSEQERKRRKQTGIVVNLGLGANIVLATAKVTGGILGHSQALLADGINSISDVVYLIVVRFFVALSGKPADPEHPYGHHQFESIAALVVGAFVITTGIAIFWDSVNFAFDLFTGQAERLPLRSYTLYLAGGTVLAKCALMLHAFSVAKKTESITVSAIATDHRNDIFSSLGAAVGIVFGLLGYYWLDPLAGALVAIVVTKAGFDILRESSAELMDSVPSREIDARIRSVLTGIHDVQTIESVHAHRFGPYYVVNITIGIDGDLRVNEGDEIADSVEARLYERIEMLRKVYVHYHPARSGK